MSVDSRSGGVLINERPSLVMENPAARLLVDLLGGSFAEFQFQDQKLNPLVWNNSGDPKQPRQMSHFLCLDRWGWPSEAEAGQGMPYHGEAGLVEWRIIDRPSLAVRGICAQLRAHLPMANLEVRRWIFLDCKEAVFTVTESVTNFNRLGSVLNMVPHPNIGPPFLDENTVIDANAAEGFVLANTKPHPERWPTWWPQALDSDGRCVNMRYLKGNHDPNVVAYVIDEELGWTTASNPSQGLLIGYLWRAAEYPWFVCWRRADHGKPFARGLEFGTTGLDWPHGELLRKGQIFGRSLFVHLDAGETLTKSFTGFLLRIPKDYAGVGAVRRTGTGFTVRERGTANTREIAIDSATLSASSQ
jgi:hypothetical protein